jgi:hypothetical protein
MRILTLAASAAAMLLPATAVQAQYYGRDYRGYQREVRQEQRECRRELRRADSRREFRQELRECRRELRDARRDYRRDDRHYYGRRGYDRRHGLAYQDPRLLWDGYRWRYRY